MTTYLTSINNQEEAIEKTLIDLGYQLSDRVNTGNAMLFIEMAIIEPLYKSGKILESGKIS